MEYNNDYYKAKGKYKSIRKFAIPSKIESTRSRCSSTTTAKVSTCRAAAVSFNTFSASLNWPRNSDISFSAANLY